MKLVLMAWAGYEELVLWDFQRHNAGKLLDAWFGYGWKITKH